MATYRPAPVRFVSGKGCRLLDAEGKEYLDFLSGIAVTSLGHAHPAVAAAVAHQVETLLHVSNLFESGLNEEVAGLIDTLIGNGQPLGGKVFFANSGAEANECAIKLARRYGGHGRYSVISAFGSFHGRTLATLHATGQPSKHEPFAPLPEGFRHVAYGDFDALERAADPTSVAGILLEVIEGEGGVVPAPAGYLTDVRQLCDERGILLMLDEIQTGLGRTGRWFAFQREGVVPDVVTLAKALGNGMPVGACWARPEIAEVFVPGDHGSTFGGQPLAMSAARATLETMIDLDVPRLSEAAGTLLSAGLATLPGVVEVRGAGLLIGAVLAPGLDAGALVEVCRERGLIVNSPVPGVIRLTPPLIVSDEECDEALGILGGALGDALVGKAEVAR